MLCPLPMASPKRPKKRGTRAPNPHGRPVKAEGGLTKSVLLLMTPEMHAAVTEVARARSEREGRTITAADLQREWIAAGLEREHAGSAKKNNGNE